MHAGIGNLEILEKNATIPRYVFTSGWSLFFEGIGLSHVFKKTNSTKNEIILWRSKKLLRVDKEFQQVKIINLNDQNNVEILCGGKAFDAEQKVRENKTRISKLNAQKIKNFPHKNNFKLCWEHE